MIEEIPDRDDIDSHSNSSKNIDSVITLIAVFHVLTAILTLPMVYAIFASPMMQGPLFYIFLIWVEGVLLGATLPVYILLGIAIWRVQSWAWKVSMIVNAICLIFNIFGAAILPAILNIVLLLVLNNRDVRFALASIE